MTAVERADPLQRIYICVGSKDTGIYSYTWRIHWHRTSFYVVARHVAISGLKVSLHGPDVRHPRPHFRIDRDNEAAERAEAAGGVIRHAPGALPTYFGGREVTRRARHVLRIRSPWELHVVGGGASAPGPAPIKESTSFAGVVPPPRVLRAVDLDVYVCRQAPWWPKERRAKRDDAAFGALTNEAGEHLTVVATQRSLVDHPTPSNDRELMPIDDADRVRGISAALDPAGFYWLAETYLSRTKMAAG